MGADAASSERARLAGSQIRDDLALHVVPAGQMTAEHAAIFEAARPSAAEVRAGRWIDDVVS